MLLFWRSSRAAGGHRGLFSAGRHYRSQCSLSSDFALLGWDQLRRWGRDTAFTLPAPSPQHTLRNSLGCGQEIKGGWGQIWWESMGISKLPFFQEVGRGRKGRTEVLPWDAVEADQGVTRPHGGSVAQQVLPGGTWTGCPWDHPGTGGTGPPPDGGRGRGSPGAEGAYVSRWCHSAAG